jgi:hypothetical protein
MKKQIKKPKIEKSKCLYCKKKIEGKQISFYHGDDVCRTCFRILKQNKGNYVKEKQPEIKINPAFYEREYKELIKEFLEIQTELDLLCSNRLWKQYKILSKAYKIKKTHNPKFTYIKLADDFNISYKHCKRLMCLEKCNLRTKELIRNGKISVNKVLIVVYEKPKDMQDEIIDWILKTKASNNEIHKYRTPNIKSEKGISNDYASFSLHLKLGSELLLKLKNNASESLKTKIKGRLELFLTNVEEFIDE